MTRTLSALAISAALVTATPALAQMYPGQGIVVNPAATDQGMMYPGTPYARPIPPGGPYPGIVHLHMPVKHVARKRKPKVESVASTPPASAPAETAPAETAAPPPASDNSTTFGTLSDSMTAAQTAPPAPKPSRHKHKSETADAGAASAPAPAAASAPSADTNMGEDSALPLALAPNEATAPAPPAPKGKKVRTALANTSATSAAPSGTKGLAKRSVILFAKDQVEPAPAAAGKLKDLANDLNTLLGAGAQRIQLDAYGGAPGDKSSDARRIALKRGLAVRQVLIDNGVPPDRIDVRAMGGSDDGNQPDRVDVYLSGG